MLEGGMVEPPLGLRQHVTAVLKEGFLDELGSGKPKAALERHFVLVDVSVSDLAKDIGRLQLVVVPVVHELDGSARLERGEGHLTVLNALLRS